MKITIIGVGKIKEAYFRDAVAEYSKRLSKYCKFQIIEVADEECPENASAAEEEQIKDREGEKILKKIPNGAYVIALAIDGKKVDRLMNCRLLKQAVEMLDDDGKATLNEVRGVLSLVRERLTALLNYG